MEKLVGKIAMHLIKIQPHIHFARTVMMYQMVELINVVLAGATLKIL